MVYTRFFAEASSTPILLKTHFSCLLLFMMTLANFVLCKVTGASADDIKASLRKKVREVHAMPGRLCVVHECLFCSWNSYEANRN